MIRINRKKLLQIINNGKSDFRVGSMYLVYRNPVVYIKPDTNKLNIYFSSIEDNDSYLRLETNLNYSINSDEDYTDISYALTQDVIKILKDMDALTVTIKFVKESFILSSEEDYKSFVVKTETRKDLLSFDDIQATSTACLSINMDTIRKNIKLLTDYCKIERFSLLFSNTIGEQSSFICAMSAKTLAVINTQDNTTKMSKDSVVVPIGILNVINNMQPEKIDIIKENENFIEVQETEGKSYYSIQSNKYNIVYKYTVGLSKYPNSYSKLNSVRYIIKNTSNYSKYDIDNVDFKNIINISNAVLSEYITISIETENNKYTIEAILNMDDIPYAISICNGETNEPIIKPTYPLKKNYNVRREHLSLLNDLDGDFKIAVSTFEDSHIIKFINGDKEIYCAKC